MLLSGLTRRAFFSSLLVGVAGIAAAQKASLQNGKVVVCAENKSTARCPQGHEVCREIDAKLVVGNGDRDYPNWAQVNEFTMLWCPQCHALFAEKA